MTEFEKKLLTDLRNGKSVDAILNKFNETLTKVNEEYQAENRLAAEAARKQEEERKAAEKRAAEQKQHEFVVKEMAKNMDMFVRAWAKEAIPSVNDANVDEMVPQSMLDAVREAITTLIEPVHKTRSLVSELFDLFNSIDTNTDGKTVTVTIDQDGRLVTKNGKPAKSQSDKSDEAVLRNFLTDIL